MKQFMALVLTLCVALMGLSGFAEEAQSSDLPTVEDLKARIESFEQNHPELESLFSGLTRDLQDIYQEEMTKWQNWRKPPRKSIRFLRTLPVKLSES